MSVAAVVGVAVPFVWCGAVLDISFLEAPLMFRAPGITRQLGLGIGMLVFRALNLVELILALALAAATAWAATGTATGTATSGTATSAAGTAVLVAIWLILLAQLGGPRPVLERRARLVVAGETPPPTPLHLVYVGLEAIKLVLLPACGVLSLLAVASPAG
ncbi:MAG TPA: hypothetical protein VGH99_02435 [Pseudonocardia sp.]